MRSRKITKHKFVGVLIIYQSVTCQKGNQEIYNQFFSIVPTKRGVNHYLSAAVSLISAIQSHFQGNYGCIYVPFFFLYFVYYLFFFFVVCAFES